MRVEYTKRATDDLRKVSKEIRAFGHSVAAAVEARIREIIARISERPAATSCSLALTAGQRCFRLPEAAPQAHRRRRF
jgi:plasmid stabilization system protein ParE